MWHFCGECFFGGSHLEVFFVKKVFKKFSQKFQENTLALNG